MLSHRGDGQVEEPRKKYTHSKFNQNLILDGDDLNITKVIIDSEDVNGKTVQGIAEGDPIALGLAAGYRKNGRIHALAISTMKRVLIVTFKDQKLGEQAIWHKGIGKIQQGLLCRTVGSLFSFDMAPLAMSLHHDAGLRITNGVDVQSAMPKGKGRAIRDPVSVITTLLGNSEGSAGAPKISNTNIERAFNDLVYSEKTSSLLAMRAWIAQYIGGHQDGSQFDAVARINTEKWTREQLDIISKITGDTLRLFLNKPTQQEHAFEQVAGANGPRAKVESYEQRIRSSKNLRIQAVTSQGGQIVVPATAGAIEGAMVDIKDLVGSDALQGEKTMMKVISEGRDDPTNAEFKQAAFMLEILQGQRDIFGENPWFRNIWKSKSVSEDVLAWPEDWTEEAKRATPMRPTPEAVERLNRSQLSAVNRMLSSTSHHITIIQGPPGTGKTSVIAQFVIAATRCRRNDIWLVAQSNVAVKNIAEKLASEDFWDWRLLVSNDFHEYWHEHLYEKVKQNMIRSSEFMKLSPSHLTGCKVILCTLSMLSNKFMSKFTRFVPLRTLVVDEASQIQTGDYIPALMTFSVSLRKVCFIGDDKQLPPFGQEELQDLQSIFEVDHLRADVLFLDTQYRMPPYIGQIISDGVYNSELCSNPKHPISDDIISCCFINVDGKEQKILSGSQQNAAEHDAVVRLAQILQDKEKEYKIITPYEGQRSLIENTMKNIPELNWENKCFNVDSFQGNEEDYIIISLVRTRNLGFLTNLRRTNVMLSRCKKGMFIVCNREFLERKGKESLVGFMMNRCGDEAWATLEELTRNIAKRRKLDT